MRYQKSEDWTRPVQAVNRLLNQLEVSLGQGEPAKQEFVEVIQIMKELVSETGHGASGGLAGLKVLP